MFFINNEPMNKWIFVILLAFGYGLYTQTTVLRPKESQNSLNQNLNVSLAAATNDHSLMGIPKSCVGKKYCITAFIAPWCGVCQTSEPTFLALNKHLATAHPDVGFGLVIGADKPETNALKQNQLSSIESYTDDSGNIMKLREIRAFPTWITIDENGKEVYREAGGFRVTTDDQMPGLVSLLLGNK